LTGFPFVKFLIVVLCASVICVLHPLPNTFAAESASPKQPAQPSVQATVTFSRDIAPIIFGHCTACHRPGQSGPFSLLDYRDVQKRAKQIVELTQRRSMPPWLPEPGYGEFANERRLSDRELELIRQWVADGTQEGKASELPPQPAFPEGWALGKPDLVIEMPVSYQLPGDGKDVYRNFVIPVPLATNRYVKAVEFKPGNPKIVHHAFVKVDPLRRCRALNGKDGQPGFGGMGLPDGVQMPEGHFLAWQPGKLAALEPEELAWRLGANSDVILQTHLRPSGKPELLRASVGLYFSDRTPTNTCTKLALLSLQIDIPAGDTNYVVEDSLTLPAGVQLLAILPHAHYLCRRMEAFATLPDGSRKWLLLIRNWDFNWQGDYRYRSPVLLPRGTKVSMRYTYDNSSENVANPNQPPRRVRYGGQSTDEMAELWLQLLPLERGDSKLLAEAYAEKQRSAFTGYNEFLVRTDPKNVEAQTELGFIRFLEGKNKEAIERLTTAISLAPTNDKPHYKLGVVLRQEGRLAEAQAELETALKLNPSNNDAHGNLGVIFAEQGKLQLAEDQLRSALRINPDDPVARSLLAELLQAEKKLPRKN
jgi:tetratricopeptide (TPR) repeat protein/mono/diheme cytochrome c family protein